MAKAAPAWPALKTEIWPIDRVKPYAKNARIHSLEDIRAARAAIEQYGWTYPLLVDENDILIAGHRRLAAAMLEPPIEEVPVMVAKGWSENQIKAYRIWDNKSTLSGGWDDGLLRAELAELGAANFIDFAGFSIPELGELQVPGFITEERIEEAEETPDAPKTSVLQLGELWKLGKHRLIIGDSADPATVERVLDGAVPHLMVTDPPYGVEYDANWRNQRVRKNGTPIAGRAVGKVKNDDRADWRDAFDLFPGDVAYAWSAGLRSKEAIEGLEGAGFVIRAQIIWAKTRFAIGRGDYHFQHEPCWYAVRKGKTGHWSGDRKQTTLWTINHIKSETGHSTQKPIDCMRRPILNNSKVGDAIYDPFCGSGTSLISAEMEKRVAYCVELDPCYAEVIIRRWQSFTKKTAVREDGMTFEDVLDAAAAGAAIKRLATGEDKLVNEAGEEA